MSVQQTCLTVLGSTGSIGVNTLDVVARHPGRFRVYALTACTDHESMLAQCREHRPAFAVLVDGRAAEQLKAGVIREGLPTEVLSGKAALEQVASDADVDAVMAAIVGAAGLMPTLAAARAGKRVLLANKEALVMSGALFMDAVRRNGAEIVPIDSEHNAIFQCLGGRRDPAKQGVRRIILTASGGPFRERDTASLARATPEEACAHPNWDMGAKISVDSATLMNKGLEVIEACWLFDVGPDDVEVVIHPQSIIHSMVEYDDGSVLAQLGHPDMRIPIASGLGFPRRMSSGLPAIEFADLAALTFERADTGRFPCLLLGYEAAKRGGRAPTVLNAANEVAVARFLDGALGFQQISRVVRQVLETAEPGQDATIDEVVATDRRARRLAETTIAELQGSPA